MCSRRHADPWHHAEAAALLRISLAELLSNALNCSQMLTTALPNIRKPACMMYCGAGAEAAAWLLGYCATEPVARRTLCEAGAASALMPVRYKRRNIKGGISMAAMASTQAVVVPQQHPFKLCCSTWNPMPKTQRQCQGAGRLPRLL